MERATTTEENNGRRRTLSPVLARTLRSMKAGAITCGRPYCRRAAVLVRGTKPLCGQCAGGDRVDRQIEAQRAQRRRMGGNR